MRFIKNSSIGIKEKICVSCGKPCFWFSKRRCQQCAKIEETGKKIERESARLIAEDGLTELIAEADLIVSRYVRAKAKDKDGNCQCYTCPAKLPVAKMQAGHYIKRGHLFLRWDADRNIRPQCEHCNCYKNGNLAIFAQNLEKEKPGLPDILMEESALVYKPTREEVKQIIIEYLNRLRAIAL